MIRIDRSLIVRGDRGSKFHTPFCSPPLEPRLLTVGGGGGLWCFPSLSYLEKLCKLHFLDLQRPWAQVLIGLRLCIFILFTFQRSSQT